MNIMKKISLFVLGILFCVTNAWGQFPMAQTAEGINYNVNMGPLPNNPSQYAMYAEVTGLVNTNLTTVTIPATATLLGFAQNVLAIASGAFSSF